MKWNPSLVSWKWWSLHKSFFQHDWSVRLSTTMDLISTWNFVASWATINSSREYGLKLTPPFCLVSKSRRGAEFPSPEVLPLQLIYTGNSGCRIYWHSWIGSRWTTDILCAPMPGFYSILSPILSCNVSARFVLRRFCRSLYTFCYSGRFLQWHLARTINSPE